MPIPLTTTFTAVRAQERDKRIPAGRRGPDEPRFDAPVEILPVRCINGVFMIPDALLRKLQNDSPKGYMYLRQDEDVLTIAPFRLADGRRRMVNARVRAPIFRQATHVMVVPVGETLQVMPIDWRGSRLPQYYDQTNVDSE